MTRRLLFLIVPLAALAASSGCKNKQIDQLRADSTAAEGDLFIWANTVQYLQKDSAKGGGESGPELTNQSLQRARARLAEAWNRRAAATQQLAPLTRSSTPSATPSATPSSAPGSKPPGLLP